MSMCPSIRAMLELIGLQRVLVGGAHEGGAESAGVVRVRHPNGRCGAELGQERANACDGPDQVVRGEGQDRVLDGALRERGIARASRAIFSAPSRSRVRATVRPSSKTAA
jgi:hypothetical protein